MDEKLKQEITELIKELENKDSISIGNSKTGEIKVYCDFGKKDEAVRKIDNAIQVLREKRGLVLG